MLDNVLEDKIVQTIKIININFSRIDYALLQVNNCIPLEKENYYLLPPNTISFIDQYIFRFAKCQDVIGDKLFRYLLLSVEEEIDNEPFLNILNRLEKIGILSDKNEWIELRKLRNLVSHEYPVLDDESVAALNALFVAGDLLRAIYQRCVNFLRENHQFNFDLLH